ALLALAATSIVLALATAASWGRRARPTVWARVPALALARAVSVAATLQALSSTLDRRNRLLAGGVTALVMVGVVLVASVLAPALARALSGRGVRTVVPARVDPAVWLLLAPFVLVAGAAMVVVAAARARLPMGAPTTRQIAVQVSFVAALLPALLMATERLPVRLQLARSLPAAALVWGVATAIFLVRTWSSDLRFLPWIDLACAAAIAAGVVVAARLLGARKVQRLVIGAAVAVALSTTLAASESEAARKVVARGGLVGPVLAQARRALDFDRDGYARLLGGGDCDDGDPTIHPGVLDFPDDGLDQDCDGKDASVSVLAPPPFAAVPDAVPRDLNLVLITIDTVRADHLSCYGYGRPTSPHLDALAREGALFVNGWAHAPSTRYSMPAIATGRWPSAITWDESIWWPRIAPSMRTLPEALKGAGYVTAAFYSFDYFALAERRGFERGVDVYRADRATLHRAVNGPMESRGTSSREMADDAAAFFEAHRTQKFFLWVHFYDPHLSYEPHPEVPSFGDARMDLYDGEIAFTDLHVGRMLARLRELGLWDRTAVVVTGDHGEGFGEHGVTEHGFDLYGPQTKVPLIARVPGLPAARVTAPAGHVDLAPTLLNLARGPAEPAFLGRSLMPELSGRDDATAAVFQEVSSERGKKRALVTRNFHLIWNWTPENTTECYDLAQDPTELHDLWGHASAGECPRLKAQLQGMVSALSVPPGLAARLK
ncbi:MAG TPA: sulfatase-like hydrolase/transferase, partial [Polyangia bacterium]|nr:sulfatase-like hydrolase/transferase [Polyangia bacterium]